MAWTDDAENEIRNLLTALRESWLASRFETLEEFFRPDVVFVLPGLSERIIGSAAALESYREFMHGTKILNCTEEIRSVQGWESTAVAIVHWQMTWESGGSQYNEQGNDIYTLVRDGDSWKIALRAILPSPEA